MAQLSVNSASLKKLYSDDNSREEDEIFLEPYHFAAANGNFMSNILNSLLGAFNYWFQVPESKLQEVVELLRPLLTFDMLDDIQDNAMIREKTISVHEIFGVDRTLIALNYANQIILKKYIDLGRPELMSVYIEAGLKTFKGQGIEIYWRDNCICPTEEEYRKMTRLKAGGNVEIVLRFLQLFSENKTDYTAIASMLGEYCQIFNDYISLRSKKYMEMEGFCSDISEGKFTFPIIHAIRSHPEDDHVMDIVKQKTQDMEMKKYCVHLLEKYGSFEYTEKALERLRNEIEKEVNKVGENPMLMQIVDYCYLKLEIDVYLP